MKERKLLYLMLVGLLSFLSVDVVAYAQPEREFVWDKYNLEVDGKTYIIRYHIERIAMMLESNYAPAVNSPIQYLPFADFPDNGGSSAGSSTNSTLISITADPASATLNVKVNATWDGELAIVLPRNMIQALTEKNVPSGGSDVNYVVFVNEIETHHDEATEFYQELSPDYNDTRILSIPFYGEGVKDIMIVGTWVVPEFSAVAVIVLAVSMGGIISFGLMYRRKFNPS